MELEDYLRFGGTLIFVLGLMGLLAFVLKRSGLAGAVAQLGPAKRLKIIEVLPLDHRRRAVLLKRDDTEHLVILGAAGETVIETGIKAVSDDKPQS